MLGMRGDAVTGGMRRATAWMSAAAVAVVLLTSCGGDDAPEADVTASPTTTGTDPSPTGAPSADQSEPTVPTTTESHASTGASEPAPAEPDGVVIAVRLRDGQVTPNGERVRVEAGVPFTFVVESDVAGSLHAHSTPEQSIEFTSGRTSERMTIDQPGIVEVELHEPPLVVVQLEVR